jgi:hypothetical protein
MSSFSLRTFKPKPPTRNRIVLGRAMIDLDAVTCFHYVNDTRVIRALLDKQRHIEILFDNVTLARSTFDTLLTILRSIYGGKDTWFRVDAYIYCNAKIIHYTYTTDTNPLKFYVSFSEYKIDMDSESVDASIHYFDMFRAYQHV